MSLSRVILGAFLVVLAAHNALAGWPTTTTITSSLNPSNYGAQVTLTVTVSSTVCPGTGSVTLTGPGGFYASGNVSGCVNNSSKFQVTTSTLPAGSDQLIATYAGHPPNFYSSQGQMYQTVKPPPEVGYINPKYLVVGVVYAPPGASSSVTYTGTTFRGSTSQISSSFSSGVTESISMTNDISAWEVSAGFGVKVTNSASNAFTQTSNSSTTVSTSTTTSNSIELTPGTPTFSPVNHDYDLIALWVNPLLIFTVNPNAPSNIQWNGYGYDSNDPTGNAGPDIEYIPVGWLNGHFGSSPAVATILARSWVTTYEPSISWPNGPGITCSNGVFTPGCNSGDIQQILAADPFTSSTYFAQQFGSSPPSTTADHRFTEENFRPNPINYIQGGVTTGFDLTYANTQSVSQGASTTFTETFGTDRSFSSGLLAIFTEDFKITNTFTWTNTWLNTVTSTQTLSRALSITPPSCTGEPCSPLYTGPGDFLVYYDNLYGTFSFVPAPN
jgi:hypothetical protein